MDLQSVDQLKAPFWRALRLGAVMFLVVASGLLLSSLISTSHGRAGLSQANTESTEVPTAY